jgi:hypothetical protein
MLRVNRATSVVSGLPSWEGLPERLSDDPPFVLELCPLGASANPVTQNSLHSVWKQLVDIVQQGLN